MDVIDQGAILRSGAQSVRDYAAEDQQAQLLGLQQIQAQASQQRAQTDSNKQNDEFQRRGLYQQEVANLLQKPTAAGIASLVARFPEFGEQAQSAFDLLDEKQQKSDLRSMAEVYSAASAGKFDLAATALKRRIDADKAAGDVDEDDARLLAELESGDPARQRAALTYMGMGLSFIAPKEFATAFNAVNKVSEPNLRSVSPGDIVYDERTGEKVFESPYRPTTQTVTDPVTGQTTIVQLGGGDRSQAGGDLFARVLRAEGGTDAQGNFRTSPKGAVGPAQVMPATAPEAAKLAGLPYDEKRYRSDGEYNKAIGRAYLAKQVSDFGGDEAKAAAAYNAGPGRVKAAISKGGQGWLALLPEETRNYVAKVTGSAIPPGFVLD